MKYKKLKYKDEVGDDFDEKVFSGPVHEQVQSALKYIKDLVIMRDDARVFQKFAVHLRLMARQLLFFKRMTTENISW